MRQAHLSTMSEQTDRQFARLSRMIQAGMVRCVFLWGTCGWGLIAGTFFFVATYFLGWQIGNPIQNFLLPILGIFAVAGTAWGLLLWLVLRWQYSRRLKARAAASNDGA